MACPETRLLTKVFCASGRPGRALLTSSRERAIGRKAAAVNLDPPYRGCSCGTNRSQFREYKLPPAVYFPVESPVTRQRPPQHRPDIDPTRWPEIAARAEHESLRHLAAAY